MASFLESIKNWLVGEPEKQPQLQQLSTQTPVQQNLQNEIIKLLGPILKQQYQPFNFAPIEERARTQFATQTIPSIAERFTAFGGQSRQSPALVPALGQAGADLESQLAALKSNVGLQQQNRRDLMAQNLLGLAFRPQFENLYTGGLPSTGGFLGNLGTGIGSALPVAGLLGLAHYLGGGSGLGNLFGAANVLNTGGGPGAVAGNPGVMSGYNSLSNSGFLNPALHSTGLSFLQRGF